MGTINNFLNRVGSPTDIKAEILESATRRGLSTQTYEEYKLHLLGELGEATEKLLKTGGSLRSEYVTDSGKPEGFYAELIDVIILSLCVEQLGMWKWVDSPYPIAGRKAGLIFQLHDMAGLIDKYNALPHTIIEWFMIEHNEIAIDKIVAIFKQKVKYNSERCD